jgi:hypothetical protein
MLKVGVNWPDFKPNLWYLGPVLLKLLDSLEVKISLSQKELIFKLFLGTAVCSRSGEAAIPQLPAASRAGSESVFNFVPDSHLIYAILPPRASTNRFLPSYKSFLFFLSPLSHLLSRDKAIIFLYLPKMFTRCSQILNEPAVLKWIWPKIA